MTLQEFDLLITSPLARAVETAHIAFGPHVKRFMISPELVETAEPFLGGPQVTVIPTTLISQPLTLLLHNNHVLHHHLPCAPPRPPACCPTRPLTTARAPLTSQRGYSVADMVRSHPFLDQWDLSLIEEGRNWVLGELVNPSALFPSPERQIMFAELSAASRSLGLTQFCIQQTALPCRERRASSRAFVHCST